ncbi:MAG TPA: AAA family ATPase, partial [Planctomycetaceae bacterium]|nr:AAA family ATPase [Planctomycetaceae bacterium]
MRNLIQRQPTPVPPDGRRARVVAFTSGKGGVGKSNLALNAAVALAQLGSRVCVLDANWGLSNIDLLCGLNCYWNLSHVLTGAKSLSEVILKGPEGINVVPGASGLMDLADSGDRAPRGLDEQLDAIEAAYDFLIVDTGAGLHRAARQFAAAADVTFIVTTPEPTAIADAYATLKAWHAKLPNCPEVLVNRAESVTQAKQILDRIAQTTELFLRCDAPAGCSVAEDCCVPQAVVARQPFVCLSPDSAASRDVRQIAKRLRASSQPTRKETFFGRFACRDRIQAVS